MNNMKTTPILVGLLLSTTVFAQTKNIFGKFTKSDGSQLKGTSTTIGYENQLAIISYTGGSDNTATIEIEIPMGTAVGELRNIMNAAIAVPTTVQVAVNTKPIAQSATINQSIQIQKSPQMHPVLPKPANTIPKAEITIGNIRAAVCIVSMCFAFVPYIGWIISLGINLVLLGFLVLWIVGLINAANGEQKPLPIFGNKAQDLLKGIK